jgi:hypothetical protein
VLADLNVIGLMSLISKTGGWSSAGVIHNIDGWHLAFILQVAELLPLSL